MGYLGDAQDEGQTRKPQTTEVIVIWCEEKKKENVK